MLTQEKLKIIAEIFAYIRIFSYLCSVFRWYSNTMIHTQLTLFINTLKTHRIMNKKSIWEVLLRIVIAAATAALTALGTTACMGV